MPGLGEEHPELGVPLFRTAPRVKSTLKMSQYLAIFDKDDNPLYELEFGSARGGADGHARFSDSMKELNLFIAHAALDVVDDTQWLDPALYLKSIDSFNEFIISAYVTGGNTRFLLMHESKNEEAIRQLFNEVYDLYVKTILSPFYKAGQPVKSPTFDARIRAACRKYF